MLHKKSANLFWLLSLFSIGLLQLSVPVLAAPITFNTALPVAEGEFIYRGQYVLNQSGNDPSGLDRDRTQNAGVSVLGYGINSKLAVFGVLPYLDTQLDLSPGGQPIERSANGIGDASFFGRYTIIQQDGRGTNFRIAPFFGVTAPTGEDDERDELGRLPISVQPGSGAWDVFGGAILTYQTLDYQIDAQISHRANNEANNIEVGDVTRLDTSLQYRLWPRELRGGVPGFLYGVLESNLIFQDENQINGVDDINTNGTRLFLTPGLQYVTRRWLLETAVQLPIVRDLNGTALENDFIFRAGFRINF